MLLLINTVATQITVCTTNTMKALHFCLGYAAYDLETTVTFH